MMRRRTVDGGESLAVGSRRSADGCRPPTAIRQLPTVVFLAILAAGCRTERAEAPRRVLGGLITLVPAAPAPRPERDTAVFVVPPDSLIPANALGNAIRRGRAIALATRDSLRLAPGGALRCASCHLEAGTKRGALPWVGSYARYPRLDARGQVLTVHERINICLRRNLRAAALSPDDPHMEALVAYIAFLSRGVRLGSMVEGQGDDTLSVRSGNPDAGRSVWKEQCATCHGPRGQGTARGGPVWGPRSFTATSELANWSTFAGFLRGHMSAGGRRSALTDQQVANVASFVLRQARAK